MFTIQAKRGQERKLWCIFCFNVHHNWREVIILCGICYATLSKRWERSVLMGATSKCSSPLYLQVVTSVGLQIVLHCHAHAISRPCMQPAKTRYMHITWIAPITLDISWLWSRLAAVCESLVVWWVVLVLPNAHMGQEGTSKPWSFFQ